MTFDEAARPQRSRRWLYGSAALCSVVSAAVGSDHLRRYVSHDVDEAGLMVWLWAPLLFALLSGLLRPHAPVRTAVVLWLLYLAAAAPLFGEGLVCISVMLALFLLPVVVIAALTGLFVRWFEERRAERTAPLSLLLLLPAAGVLLDPYTRPGPVETTEIADSVDIAAAPDAVWGAIERLDLTLAGSPPWLVRLLLPRPLRIEGHGAQVGDRRRVVFDNGVLTATVVDSSPGRRFRIALEIESAGREFFDHWADLEDSTFVLQPLPSGGTRLHHVTRYRPRAFPRFCFEPAERVFASLLQRQLLEAFLRQRFSPVAAPLALR